MKRMMLKQGKRREKDTDRVGKAGEKETGAENRKKIVEEIMRENGGEFSGLVRYFSELRLLKGVPFSYLVPDEAFLPPESIRFFYLDENWLDAFNNGAMSVGRAGREDASIDAEYFGTAAEEATRQLSRPRFERMHRNHRRTKTLCDVVSQERFGFLIRSELVGKWKALEVFGYQEERQLPILRMESLSSEVLLCIFDGTPEQVVISEPKTGLRFGAPDHTGVITLRNPSDTDAFGTLLEGVTVDLNGYTDENGRLHASDLAGEIQKKLGNAVGSGMFAFELIAVARRAEFYRGGE